MRRAILGALLALIAAAAVPLAGCYDDVEVVQGTVVTNDREQGLLVLKDERSPHAELAFAGSSGGVKPGDLVRVAYRDRDGKRALLRLQNLSRGEDKKKH